MRDFFLENVRSSPWYDPNKIEWENFVGYEMDGAAYLESISRHLEDAVTRGRLNLNFIQIYLFSKMQISKSDSVFGEPRNQREKNQFFFCLSSIHNMSASK